MEALRWRSDGTLLRIEGFPEMTPQHCRLMEGWVTATMNGIGVDVIDGRVSACPSRGDPAHDFSYQWKKRSSHLGFRVELSAGRARTTVSARSQIRIRTTRRG